jgi:hypothetical protein
MDCVTCLCVGDKYDDQYVIKLQRMVSLNTTRPYEFVCFSDRLIYGVNVVLIDDPLRYDPVWYKLWILQHPKLSNYNQKVFLDLDVVIHNNIDWLFDIECFNLVVVGSDWKPDKIKHLEGDTGYNSSVMVWHDARDIWDAFDKRPDYFMLKYKGIDRFLWNERLYVSTLPSGRVYSYREGASLSDRTSCKYRSDYCICIFNQHPKPLDVLTVEPVKTFWI